MAAKSLSRFRTHIVICGSMSALHKMELLAHELRLIGFQVSTPVPEEADLVWTDLSATEAVARKRVFLADYFNVIRDSDVVLIANYAKHGIDGYVGPNTLMEAACGFALRKPVYFLNPIGTQPASLELAAISGGILDGNPTRLPDYLRQKV